MNNHYKLRVNLTHCKVDDVISLIDKQCKTYAYVMEKGTINGKPHIHAYLITSKKEDTIRTQYRKLTTSCQGNPLYSLGKLVVTEGKDYALEYLAYMLKEGDPTTKDFVGDWVSDAKAHDLVVKKEMKEKKIKKQSRTKRIFELFEKEHPKTEGMVYHNVIDWVILFFVREECNVSVSTLASWSNTLLLKYDIQKHRTTVSQLVHLQLIPRI